MSLDVRGMGFVPRMGPVLERYFGDLYDSCVLTLPHRICGPREAGFVFTYGSSTSEQARKVLNTAASTVALSSVPGETVVVVYDPAGVLGEDDAVYSLTSVDGPCSVVCDPTGLLQTVNAVIGRIYDDEVPLKTCQLFLFDFPKGVDGNLLNLIDTVTELPYGGVSVNLFFNSSLRISGEPDELRRLASTADRFEHTYTAGAMVFTDSNGLSYVCAEPPDADVCARFMESYRGNVR